MRLERAILGAPLEPVAVPGRPARPEPVVLLQGIVRSRFSLRRMARGLAAAGFEVYNTGGPSPRQPLEDQVAKFRRELEQLGRRFQERYPGETPTVHGFGHSMGGIVLRVALARAEGIRPGRLVAAAAPFLGARVAEFVGNWSAARRVLGPALEDLSWKSAAIRRLASAATGEPEIGIILSQAGFQPLLPASWINAYLGLKDTDGTIQPASARGDDLWPPPADVLALRCGHTFIAEKRAVIDQTAHFLIHGRFDHARPAARDGAAGAGRAPAAPKASAPVASDQNLICGVCTASTSSRLGTSSR